MNTDLLLDQLNENTLVVNEIPNGLKTKIIKKKSFFIEYGYVKYNNVNILITCKKTYKKYYDKLELLEESFNNISVSNNTSKRTAISSVPSSAGSMIPERKTSRLNDNLNDESTIVNDDTNDYEYDEYINDNTGEFSSINFKKLDDYHKNMNLNSFDLRKFKTNLSNLRKRIDHRKQFRIRGSTVPVYGKDVLDKLFSNFDKEYNSKFNHLINYFKEDDVLFEIVVHGIERRFSFGRDKMICKKCSIGDRSNKHKCCTNNIILIFICIHISCFIGERIFDKINDFSFQSIIMLYDEIFNFLNKNLERYFQLRFKLILYLDSVNRNDFDEGFKLQVIDKYNQRYANNSNLFIRSNYDLIGKTYISTDQCIIFSLDLVFTNGICYNCGGILKPHDKKCLLCEGLKNTNSSGCFAFELWFYNIKWKHFPKELENLLISPLDSFYYQYSNMVIKNDLKTNSFIHYMRFDDIDKAIFKTLRSSINYFITCLLI